MTPDKLPKEPGFDLFVFALSLIYISLIFMRRPKIRLCVTKIQNNHKPSLPLREFRDGGSRK
jgi:hypothetical protein